MKRLKPAEMISTVEAVEQAKKFGIHTTKPSIITWIVKYKLGRKFAGRWYIDRKKFTSFLIDEGWRSYSGKYKKVKK